jgi:hypothetical protein
MATAPGEETEDGAEGEDELGQGALEPHAVDRRIDEGDDEQCRTEMHLFNLPLAPYHYHSHAHSSRTPDLFFIDMVPPCKDPTPHCADASRNRSNV